MTTEEPFSLDALRRFLRQSSMQGLINPAAARSRLSAVDQLAVELTEAEQHDVRSIDVDRLASRFHKLEDESIRPETLDILIGRLRVALGDFLAWKEDPASFSSTVHERPRARPRSETGIPGTEPGAGAEERIVLQAAESPPGVVAIPIRSDCTVYLGNLPLDLTEEEADRIARVVHALSRSKPEQGQEP